jgi:hypothetical protein
LHCSLAVKALAVDVARNLGKSSCRSWFGTESIFCSEQLRISAQRHSAPDILLTTPDGCFSAAVAL